MPQSTTEKMTQEQRRKETAAILGCGLHLLNSSRGNLSRNV